MYFPVFVCFTTSLIHINRRRGGKVWPAVWKTETRERIFGFESGLPYSINHVVLGTLLCLIFPYMWNGVPFNFLSPHKYIVGIKWDEEWKEFWNVKIHIDFGVGSETPINQHSPNTHMHPLSRCQNTIQGSLNGRKLDNPQTQNLAINRVDSVNLCSNVCKINCSHVIFPNPEGPKLSLPFGRYCRVT